MTNPSRPPLTPPPRTRRVTTAAMLCAAALLAAWAAAGCADPILSQKDERSPFDRYDAVRGQYAPQYVENQFGRRQPNLRGRLQPKD